MIKTKYMFSEAKTKDTTSEAKDLAPKAKDMTSWPRGLHLWLAVCCTLEFSY